ncbi:MAG: hypothetical protein EPN25_03850 [Nitrospirae bacterium]|nr:MAG: hypothetical protein EPN25_03850 [Nitrospirota bacterium]
MIKSNKGILQTAVILLSLAAVAGYLYYRTGQIRSMNAEAAKLKAVKLTMRTEQPASGNLEKIVPGKAAVALFVEDLYAAARVSGIVKHQVSTVKTADAPARMNVTRGKTGRNEKALETHSIKITLEGNYRETVEYIREVQNIERYKRIVELRMKPVDNVLKTDMTMEIYSAGGQDAAQ